ncbi:MAG TPA: hypothetical protein VGA08_01515 [Candidatus Saccharimonadales bacterium]
MKVFVLYHPDSEHHRGVDDFARELSRETGHTLDLISLDTPNGDHLARLYDVTKYPAVVATTDTGELRQLWQEEMLPTIGEVSGYFS